jgi:GT2 family glycosyltransferase
VGTLSATVVIVTKDRKDEVGRAVDSCLSQTADFELLVLDDGSRDGTAAFVQQHYPKARVVRSEISRGYIARRNEAAKLAKGEIIISMDDDAEFSGTDTVSRILEQFDDNRIAAIAIPFVNMRINDKIHQASPSADSIWITNEFVGTAYAVRKDVFLQFSGFRESLFHQGEEGDFCIRLMDRGLFVRCGNSHPILHYLSPNRVQERVELFGQRNLIVFAWANVPTVALLPHLFATIFNGLFWGIRRGSLWTRLRGTSAGLRAISQQRRLRQPVKFGTYRLYRWLKKKGPVKIDQVT